MILTAALFCNNLSIACEVDEQDNSENEVDPQDDECDNDSDSFSFFEKLIERYPILEQIINLILKLLNNFLQELDLSSV